jgi:hypothetical protein
VKIHATTTLSSTTSKEGLHNEVLSLIQNLFGTLLAQLFFHNRKAKAITSFMQQDLFMVIAAKLKNLSHRISEDTSVRGHAKDVSYNTGSFTTHKHTTTRGFIVGLR